MTPNKTTIKEFFEGEKQYTIPVYQRAYSWEKAQWEVFLEDLKEATKGENHYFFGNILLEKINGDKSNDIIDGQQRITTIIIFVRAVMNVLTQRAKNERLNNKTSNEDFLRYIQEDYLINRSKPKLEAVEYDRDYFKDVIINNDDKKHEPQTPSQKRIKEAKAFFTKALEKREAKEILALFKALENAEILSIPFANKKDSVLMFELQNNRGKNLTNMEKLKSYLAYQIYTYTPKEQSEAKLNEITKVFEEIYRDINDIKIADEDSVLNYFNISYSKFGFSYRENDDTLNYKRELKNEADENKIAWIENYVKELKNAFVDFKAFEKLNNVYKDYLLFLDVSQVYPFVLKSYRLFRDDGQKLEKVFKALEIIAFRHRLTRTGADLATRLNQILRDFDNPDSLLGDFKNICDKEPWYWGDEKIQETLKNIYELDKKLKIIPYLLMHYENHLRSGNSYKKGEKFSLKDIENPQIEHIAPQKEKGERLASGYCKYDDEFKNEYLNCIGNLSLISGSHNSAIGNKPFELKLSSYQNSDLMQLKEIGNFAENDIWDKDAIDERRDKIYGFCCKNWGFGE